MTVFVHSEAIPSKENGWWAGCEIPDKDGEGRAFREYDLSGTGRQCGDRSEFQPVLQLFQIRMLRSGDTADVQVRKNGFRAAEFEPY